MRLTTRLLLVFPLVFFLQIFSAEIVCTSDVKRARNPPFHSQPAANSLFLIDPIILTKSAEQ